ncbi:TPM domain-containing protein [Cognatiluteimonas profundi]|uniref:TPM domain-containing protein n=1 Tax=Cognatiluteimonas profundi TaxID=2594501 RepID=UPI00131CB811|nr:TPM domain-containing protein [Lysobacter profundi]
MRPLVGRWLLASLLCIGWHAAWAQSLAAIPALDSPVVDTTGTLTAEQKQALVQQALALQQRKGSQLQVLMVPTTQPETIEQYTTRGFDQYKLGRQHVDDGVLIVVAKDDHRARIEPGYGLEGAIPDAIANRIIQEYLVPKFRANDYAGGLNDASAALVKLIDGEPLPEPMAESQPPTDTGSNWLFALFAAFMVAQVVRGIFGRAPSLLRGVVGAGAAGFIAWLLSSLLLVGGLGAVIGFFLGLSRPSAGGFARGGRLGGFGGWGGGGFGGGGFGGGGGWSGGGGMSGGGGASGSW